MSYSHTGYLDVFRKKKHLETSVKENILTSTVFIGYDYGVQQPEWDLGFLYCFLGWTRADYGVKPSVVPLMNQCKWDVL